MPACESVNAVKTPITYRWISEFDVRVVDPEQRHRDRREHEDPVREDEPVAEVRELPREEPVAREERGEPREALVRRVRGEHEHGERQHLHDPVHEAERRRRREHRPGDLRQHRRRPGLGRAARACERRATSRRGTSRSRRCRARASSSRRSCRADGGTRSRRSRSPPPPSAPSSPTRTHAARRRASPHRRRRRADAASRPAGSRWSRTCRSRCRSSAGSHVMKPYVGSAKRIPASRTPRRFASAISTTQTSDRASSCDAQRRDGRGEREHARGHRDRDGQDVVGEQRRGRDEARDAAEVLLRDDVRAAGALVHLHRLPVGEDDDREQRRDRDRDREDAVRGARRGARRARRALPPSRTRPTRAGPTRRSGARATSEGASRPSRRTPSDVRRGTA